MSGLFSAINSSANALEAFQRALTVVQNNVVNSSTPGYAAQSLNLDAQPFQPGAGLPGGVSAGEIQSARNEYAEQSVQQQFSALGTLEQKAQNLSDLELNFNVSSDSGIPGALNNFLSDVSSWSVTPNDASARQAVLDSAQQVVQAFQQTSANLAQTTNNTNTQLQQNLTQINDLTSQLQTYNQQRLSGDTNDAGLDAQIHSTLEQLSEYVGFTSRTETNGSVTVLMGGQTPLVIGANQYNLTLSFSTPTGSPATVAGGVPPARILDANGNDVTSMISQGQLAGLLDVRNNVLPSLSGGAYQQGSINQLAQGFADRVNQILTSGNISDGPPPVPGIPLFTYTAGSPTAVAHTLAVNSSMTPDQLAASDPGPPPVSNGIALRIATLASPTNAADEINGVSYAEFYGNIAAQVGRESGDAQNQLTVQQQVVAQARTLRSQSSGVSLDAEAAKMIEFQRAYDAAARMVNVLDTMTQDTINMIPLT